MACELQLGVWQPVNFFNPIQVGDLGNFGTIGWFGMEWPSILLKVYEAVNHISPSFMWNIFTPKESRYNLRKKNQLRINHSRTKGGMHSLSIYGAKLWNHLPDNFKNCELQDFKDKLASWYPPKCRCSACRSWILFEF